MKFNPTPFILLLICSFGFIACTPNPADEEIMEDIEEIDADTLPLEITFDQIFTHSQDEVADRIEDGRLVTFEAYLGIQNYTLSGEYGSYDLSYFARRNMIKGNCVFMQAPGTMAIPDPFTDKDIKVISNSGDTIFVGDRVKITAEYKWPGIYREEANLDLVEIELIPEFDETVFEQAVELTLEVIEENEGEIEPVYGFVDCKLHLEENRGGNSYPFREQMYSLKLDQASNPEIISALFVTGDGPSRMRNFREYISVDDFYVYDFKGQLHKAQGLRVRLYGTYDYGFFVEEIVVK